MDEFDLLEKVVSNGNHAIALAIVILFYRTSGRLEKIEATIETVLKMLGKS